MKRMKKAGLVATSMATIAVCSSLIVGSTYALFTSEDKVDISVTAGKVSVSAEIVESSLALTSMGVAQEGNNWANGGSAGFSDKKNLDLTYITPGDSATFDIKVTNESNVNVQYRLNWSVDGELAGALEATATGAKIGYWTEWLASDEVKEKTVSVTVALPEEAGNEYQNKSASISFAIEAVQGNGVLAYDKTIWDGYSADTAWYTEADASATAYTLETAADLAGFAQLVNGGNTFKGKTVQLGANIDLNNELWTPIGKYEGTFDGANYKISNLKVIGGTDVGFFGTSGNGTLIIKNTGIVNAYVSGTDRAGVIIGTAYAHEFSNNYVENATVVCTPYEKGAGYDGGAKAGILVGHVKNASPSTPTNIYGNVIKNCEVYAYRDLGGLIGCAQNENNSRMLTVYDNELSNVYVNYLDYTNYQPYEDNKVNENIGEVVGRIISANWVDVKDDNTTATVHLAKLIADGYAEGENGNMYVYNANGVKAWHDSIKSAPGSVSGKTYNIVNDIDAEGYVWENLWLTIGSTNDSFVLDGGNHTISNLNITGNSSQKGHHGGLFAGSLGNCTVVKNITFDNVTVNAKGINDSVLFGQIYNDALIENVKILNSTVMGAYKVGALVGTIYDETANTKTVTIKDCLVQNTTINVPHTISVPAVWSVMSLTAAMTA